MYLIVFLAQLRKKRAYLSYEQNPDIRELVKLRK